MSSAISIIKTRSVKYKLDLLALSFQTTIFKKSYSFSCERILDLVRLNLDALAGVKAKELALPAYYTEAQSNLLTKTLLTNFADHDNVDIIVDINYQQDEDSKPIFVTIDTIYKGIDKLRLKKDVTSHLQTPHSIFF